MGQVATALNVTPGTATTMVKALAESGLAEYEPYSGVRLTAAGEKLAALVLRRHRLVELFLVQVMGMSWDEVHDEAEQLEHVVSDRLIELIDRDARPPHARSARRSDPDRGRHDRPRAISTACSPVRSTRRCASRAIADQDPAFLRFIESNELKPGQAIEVETRDCRRRLGASAPARWRPAITIGARAASKLLVERT